MNDLERLLCDQIQKLYITSTFNISEMNPKIFFPNTTFSVQLPYFAGHSLYTRGLFTNYF